MNGAFITGQDVHGTLFRIEVTRWSDCVIEIQSRTTKMRIPFPKYVLVATLVVLVESSTIFAFQSDLLEIMQEQYDELEQLVLTSHALHLLLVMAGLRGVLRSKTLVMILC